MDFPLTKEFERTFKIQKSFFWYKYFKKITLKYNQASLYESMEFLQNIKNPIEYYLEFLKKYSVKKLSKKDLIICLVYYKDFWWEIEKTFFLWYFEKQKQEIIINTEDIVPFSSYIAYISKEVNIEPNILFKKYTYPQIKRLSDWIVYNNQTKEERAETQRKKEREKQMDWLDEKERQRIKDFINSD